MNADKIFYHEMLEMLVAGKRVYVATNLGLLEILCVFSKLKGQWTQASLDGQIFPCDISPLGSFYVL